MSPTVRSILLPLAVLFRLVTAVRNLLYNFGLLPQLKVSLPVISVGNVAVGGSGKTPMVIWIAETLKAAGRKPVIVLRGYGGTERGPLGVQDADSAERVGDESLLVRRKTGLPVVVSRSKLEGAKYAAENGLGDVVVIDDGLQHRRLHRDLDIVLLGVGDELSLRSLVYDRLMPWGNLREGRRGALARADVIIFSHRNPIQHKNGLVEKLRALLPTGIRLLEARSIPEPARALVDGEALPRGAEIVAVCGIAGPEAFSATLQSLGYRVSAKEFFPDHYPFDAESIAALRRKYPALPLVCTEKDAVKISAPPPGMYVLPVACVLDRPDLLRDKLVAAVSAGGC